MCGKSIEDYFSGKVKSVEVKGRTVYRSFAGNNEQSFAFKRSGRDIADFYIECPNIECTEMFFDLRQETDSLFRERAEATQGEIACKGKVASDHPNQRCDTTLYYEIKIIYSE